MVDVAPLTLIANRFELLDISLVKEQVIAGDPPLPAAFINARARHRRPR